LEQLKLVMLGAGRGGEQPQRRAGSGRLWPTLTVWTFPLCSNGRWTLGSAKTTCSSPAPSGGVFLSAKLSEAKAAIRQVGSGAGTLPPGWVCLLQGSTGGLSSPWRCWNAGWAL